MLGRHVQSSQKRRIYAIAGAVGLVALIAWIVWPSGASQTPPIRPQNPPGTTQTSVPSVGASPVTTTTNTLPKSTTDSSIVDNGQGKIVALSPTSPPVGIPTTTAPTSVGLPTTTTTTVAAIPPGATVHYGAEVNPTFTQSPTDPLRVSYQATATASIVEDGQFVPVASLPAGQLEIFSSVGLICSLPVGGTVVSGMCATTYATFGSYGVVANYVVGGNTYVSVILSDDVEPYATTTVAGISGGGSLGGIVFFAAVTDVNGNPVTTGSATLTIADVTQGWSYVVSGTLAPDGAHTDDFGCLVVGNLPRVGESSGCGLSQTFVLPITPPSGDVLTETASYSGTTDWANSMSSQTRYMVP